jgi:glycosyltransferase involved in cell wall biosynthesis
MKISIIVPCYNEENYIIKVLKNINEQKKNFDLEIIVCDDGSTDKTLSTLLNNSSLFNHLVRNEKNIGKGGAIINALQKVSGDYVLIQDSDLEYSPNDYKDMFNPIFKNDADVVYGSRFNNNKSHKIMYFKNQIANKIITFLSNLATNLNLSDVEVGYKLIKTSIIKNLNLREKSFGIEIELTVKISKLNLKIYEVGVSYDGRRYEEGKKIRAIDGLIALYCIIKYKFFSK